MFREVREKRGMSQETAIRCLGGISLRRYQRWERGLLTPSSFVQTLVIWRLNSGPGLTPPNPKRSQTPWKRLKSVQTILLFFAVVAAGGAQLARSKTSTMPSLEAMVAESASKAQGELISADACQPYAERLRSTLTQLESNEHKEVLEEFSDMAKSVTGDSLTD